MNERYQNGDTPSEPSEAEVNLLITRIMIDGERTQVDYANVQPIDRPTPYFYTLQIDPEVVQTYMDEQGRYSEDITSVFLEYDDARLLQVGGPLLPAKVVVMIESTIIDELAPRLNYRKSVTYMRYLHPDAQWDVIETYYDTSDVARSGILSADNIEDGEEVADGTRRLNDDDIAILRLLI